MQAAMKPVERVLAALRRQPVDRIPWIEGIVQNGIATAVCGQPIAVDWSVAPDGFPRQPGAELAEEQKKVNRVLGKDNLQFSAFAPICHPSESPWGVKAFSRYLGEDRNAWRDWDATQLVCKVGRQLPILIDQGSDDVFLGEELKPGNLEQACICTHHPLQVRMQKGYDHSYYFIASFIDDHLRYHAKALGLPG